MSTRDAHLCVCGHPRRAHDADGVYYGCHSLSCSCHEFRRAHVERNTFVSTGRGHTPRGPGPLRERGDS